MNHYEISPSGMTFARFFPSDWRTGCLSLNLEEEGLYIRVCMYMYDTASTLPDDYKRCAMLLRVHPLKLEKVMNSLIAKGKIIRAQGRLINERVIEEFDRWRQETAARAAAAKKREDERRRRTEEQIREAKAKASQEATPQTTPPVTHHFTPQTTPPDHWGGTGVVTHPAEAKKTNEINGNGAESCHSCTTNQKPETRNQKLDNKPLPPEADAARDSGGGYLDVLNGTANDLVAFISKHAFVEAIDARRMLTTNVKTFGTDAMMEAYSVTLANMGGQFIASPYKYLIETARRIKNSGKSQLPRGAANDVAAKRERIRKHAEEAAEAFDRQRGRQ